MGPIQKTPAIVDDDSALWIFEHLRRVGMIKCECLFDAGDQFHGGSVDIPSQSRSVGRAHSKTNDQHGLRFAVMQRQREMRHELRSRRKRRHPHPVNEKLSLKAVPGRND